jgi:hypothetical protein
MDPIITLNLVYNVAKCPLQEILNFCWWKEMNTEFLKNWIQIYCGKQIDSR